MPVVPSKLIVFSQGLQFVSFEFLPNLVTIAMGESDPAENELKSNVKYHPNIFYCCFFILYEVFILFSLTSLLRIGGRVFLDNVGNTLTIAFGLICFYGLTVALSKVTNRAARIRSKFEWGFFLDLFCAGTFDFLLCGIVQVMNVIITNIVHRIIPS